MSISKSVDDFLYTVFHGQRCCLCDRRVKSDVSVCPKCIVAAPYIGKDRCHSCGLSKADCTCGERTMCYNGITAPFLYEGVARTGIKAWKYHGTRSEDFYASALAKCINVDFAGVSFDFICCVPQTANEQGERGKNQSEVLAMEVSRCMELPFLQPLVKVFDTDRQHRLEQYKKSGNVFGAFDCLTDFDLDGKVVLLIDDIKTSGATLNECAKMLLLSGAMEVYCATIAITRNNKTQNNLKE